MGRAELRYLVMKNFGPFSGEPVRIDFPEKGIVTIEGLSGNGKTHILKAIAFALGYEQTPAIKMRSWLDKGPWGVELGLSVDGLEVVRKAGSKSFIQVQGEEPLTTASACEMRLSKLLGDLEPIVLRSMTYRQQQKPGAFLSQPDSKKRAFLVKVMPRLSRFDIEAGAATKRCGIMEQACSEVEAVAKALTDSLGPQPESPRNLTDLELTYAESMDAYKQATDRLEAAKNLLGSIVAKEEAAADEASAGFLKEAAILDSRIANILKIQTPETFPELDKATQLLRECSRRLAIARQEDAQERNQVAAASKALQRGLSECDEADRNAKAARNEAESMRNEVAHIKSGKCPRCNQKWIEAQKELETLLQFIAGLEVAVVSEEQKAAQRPLVEDELRATEYTPKPILAKLEALEQSLHKQVAVEQSKARTAVQVANAEANQAASALRARQSELRALAADARLAKLKDRASDKTKQVVADLYNLSQAASARASLAAQELASAKRDNVRATEAQATWSIRKGKVDTATQAVEEARQALAAERDYVGLIKDFLGSAFEEILREVADEANAALAQVENTSSICIRFDTEEVKESGESTVAIIPVVSVRGHEGDPRAILSGGQMTMVDTATDLLALGEVASRRSGFRPGWLILDEAFDGMGQRDREGFLELLNTQAEDKLILVVSHSQEFKGLASAVKRLEVKKLGECSFIEEITCRRT